MIGERIKKLREEQNLTQEQLAKDVGVNINTLASYERKIREPKIDKILLFAKYFGVTTDYLLGLTPYHSLSEQEQANSSLRFLSMERKAQIEELEKILVDCWLNHRTDYRFFPLWFSWLIKYLMESVEEFDTLLTKIEQDAPILEISTNMTEITSLSHSFTMAMSNSFLKDMLQKSFKSVEVIDNAKK